MSLTLATIHRHATAQMTLNTPLGALLIVRTAAGLAGAWFEGQQHHPGTLAAPDTPRDALLLRAAAGLRAYFDGTALDPDLPLDLHGTPFQRAVWQALQQIPAGQTRSYAAVAGAIGAPQAVRAVGAAIGRNPLSVIVPCHRVLGRDGSLTGYAGGLERKRALLALEAASLAVA